MSETRELVPTGVTEEAYCSLAPATAKEAGTLFNAISNPTNRLSESINKVLYVRDVYAEVIECANENTGEKELTHRIVLIDKDMKSHQCVSVGVYQAVKRLMAMFGAPTWNPPLPLEVKSIDKGAKRILSLEIATDKMK